MKLYHFCAMRQGEKPGVLSYSDGTITSSADLSNLEQYRELKKKITEFMDEANNGTTEVILLSLTILGEVTPNLEVTGLPQPDAGSDTNAARCGRSG